MSKYPKINGLYKRWRDDEILPDGVKKGDFKIGEFSEPEFEYLMNNNWVWKEKWNGINMRIYLKRVDEFAMVMRIAGKTDKVQIPDDLRKWIENWLYENEEEILDTFDKNVILYGEGVSKKIQKGDHFREQHFRLFDIKINDLWLLPETVKIIGDKINLETPVMWTGTINDAIENVKSKPRYNYDGINGLYTIEGWVGCPENQLLNRFGDRIITEIKVKDFA